MSPAAIFPGQALLLASVMDIFSSDDMVGRGNFIALMYFIMSLGCLGIYFAMGWATNVVAQVQYMSSVPINWFLLTKLSI
jgi:ATP-binding cassette subfamily B (MDR/TAP) protein 1